MLKSESCPEEMVAHYARRNLADAILAALEAAGTNLAEFKPEELAAVDEFHIRGRKATLELARQLELTPAHRVLDVGCGIGGASRCLAAEYGCHVTGIDLTEEYCQSATMLADLLGLSPLVSYRQGDATALPFADASFDVAWTQHAAMNIADKATLYAEIRRVLRPGGRLAIYDVLAGTGGDLQFPVPWARNATMNHLVTPDRLRELLVTAGFSVVSWRDTSNIARAWFRDFSAKMRPGGDSPLGIHLLLGPQFREMAANLLANLNDERIVLVECIVQRS